MNPEINFGINLVINPEIDFWILFSELFPTEFVGCLRKIGLDVIELPADEAFPDCPFIEDIAIILNGTAFICR